MFRREQCRSVRSRLACVGGKNALSLFCQPLRVGNQLRYLFVASLKRLCTRTIRSQWHPLPRYISLDIFWEYLLGSLFIVPEIIPLRLRFSCLRGSPACFIQQDFDFSVITEICLQSNWSMFHLACVIVPQEVTEVVVTGCFTAPSVLQQENIFSSQRGHRPVTEHDTLVFTLIR